ncbi:uncharacterized protein LOC107272516 [Cephus cinctus]|uniref:Uncharacterized protein LOC107272516 n=1 Tax=Cephus cinctus TaxID=211228 RepID=A0AAJ7C9F3_CEPCN|nr:uncharacterized protein LOC107272516 [Cephus cinctus]
MLGRRYLWLVFLSWWSLFDPSRGSRERPPCGEHLTSIKGVIHTPNFPGPFEVPLKCRWVIDSSDQPPSNGSIIVYLTQLFVYKGLTFTEYAYYETDTSNLGATVIKEVTEGNVFEFRWFKTFRPFLVIDFELHRLEGNHVRVLDNLLDVYGFNITYEITGDEPKNDSCSVRDCSYTGHCILGADYRTFHCDCFDGFDGDNCGNGRLCTDDSRNPVCQNGGTCRHVGAEAIRCHCPHGFAGNRCEIRVTNSSDPEYSGEGCLIQCPLVNPNEQPCNCASGVKICNVTDRSTYECRIKLSNMTSLRSSLVLHGSLDTMLSKKLAKYLKNCNISSVEDLKIQNVTSTSEVTFHFFANSEDGDKIRESLNRLVQQRRLGDIALESTHFTFQQKPALKLQTLRMNQINEREVRLGDQFILSCVAQGSHNLNFTWYKDNMLVNMSKATREIWYRHLPNDGSDQHTSLLMIDKATLLDAGEYTCQVIDWGVQQCKSVYIEVRDEPDVKIIPMSVTIEKGSDIQLMCMTPNMRSIGIGFGWSKNRALLKLEPGSEVWEDLYPAGSILKISNAQKSAIYTCNVAHKSTAVRVEVVNRTMVPICTSEKAWRLDWPDTGPGSEALLDCPHQFVGRRVSRLCSMKDATTPEWQLPDFSLCLYEPFFSPYNNFQSLTMGYQNTTSSTIVIALWNILNSRSLTLYPGEGDRIINILAEIEHYQYTISDLADLHNSAEAFIQIIDRILHDEYSILNQQKVLLLQQLSRRNLIYWTNRLNNHCKHLWLSSLVVDVRPLEMDTDKNDGSTKKYYIPDNDYTYPMWYNDRISIRLRKRHYVVNNNNSNNTLGGIIVVYRNLSRFLPHAYSKELNDGTDLEYRFNSRVVTIAVSANEEINVWVDLQMQHLNNYSASWNISCGVLNLMGSWDLDKCVANTIPGGSYTNCLCSSTGTFALFHTARAVRVVLATKERATFVVILGCGSCLLQCLASCLILGFYWWKNRTWLNFLKIQCCGALVFSMGIFIYAVHSHLPENSFSLVAICLEALLLVGMSAPISQALIVYAELTHMRPRQHFQPTVIAVITGVPILAVLATELTHKSTGWRHESWWLISGSGVFNIFVTCATIMLMIFMLLYVGVLHKTRALVDENVVKKETIEIRVRILHRAAVIICGIIAMEASSIFYINSSSAVYHYVFASFSSLLGFIVIVAYVVNGEIMLVAPLFQKLKWRPDVEDERTTEPIKVCSNIGGEVENDAAPSSLMNEPYLEVRGVAAGSIDMREYITESTLSYSKTSDPAPSRFLPKIRIDHSEDINLENYSTSPRKYQETMSFETVYPGRSSGHYTPDSYGMSERSTFGDYSKFGTSSLERRRSPSSTSNGIIPEASSAKVLCSAEVESRIGVGSGTMPDVTLAIKKSDVELLTIIESKSREHSGTMPDIANTTERKQPDGEEKAPEILITDCENTSTDMLDRISHDLDYLLNRTHSKEDG